MRNKRYRNISKSDKVLIILFLLTIGLLIGSVLTSKLVQKNRPQNEFLDFVLVEGDIVITEGDTDFNFRKLVETPVDSVEVEGIDFNSIGFHEGTIFATLYGKTLSKKITVQIIAKETEDLETDDEEDILDEDLINDQEDDHYSETKPQDKPTNNPSGDGTTNRPSNKPEDKPSNGGGNKPPITDSEDKPSDEDDNKPPITDPEDKPSEGDGNEPPITIPEPEPEPEPEPDPEVED